MPSDLPNPLLQTLVKQGVINDVRDVSELSGGRTNRVWRFQNGDQPLVLKLFAEAGGAPLFPNDPDAERLILTALSGTRLAPELHAAGTSDQGRWVLYTYISGQSWQHDARAVGKALRQLHGSSAVSGLRSAPNGSAELIAQTHSVLAECRGAFASELLDLQPRVPDVPATHPALIHGDPVPANILVRDDQVTFIDWQCPAMGDPCEDLAIFLSPAMQHVYRGTPLRAAERDALFDGYEDAETFDRYQALAPLFHWRMAAYCLWRVKRGAPEYAEGFELERVALANALQILKPE